MNDNIKIYKDLVSPFNQSKILLHNEKFHELKSNIIAVPVCCEIDLADGFCNNKCRHCFFGTNTYKEKILMDESVIKNVLVELKDIGVKAIEFSGGGGQGRIAPPLGAIKKKMSTEDWYRNTSWNKEIEEAFENRLKRSRGDFHKAQYLRIQASHLLHSSNAKIQEKGIELMKRVISSYPNENDSVFANEQLGDFYFSKSDFESAEKYFEIVIEYYSQTKSRSGTSSLADLKLCEIILLTNQKEKFEKAYNFFNNFEKLGGRLLLNSDKFYYGNVRASLCYEMKKYEEASAFAKQALEITKITEPQFSKHKTVGLVNTTEKQIEKLKMIENCTQQGL